MQLVPPQVPLHRQNGQETALQHCPMGRDNHHPGRHHSPPTCRMSLCRPCCLPPPRPSLRQPRLCFTWTVLSREASQTNEQRAAKATGLTAYRWHPRPSDRQDYSPPPPPKENTCTYPNAEHRGHYPRRLPAGTVTFVQFWKSPSPSYLIWRSSCAPSRWRRPWRQEALEPG
jgi:hypothetical protein